MSRYGSFLLLVVLSSCKSGQLDPTDGGCQGASCGVDVLCQDGACDEIVEPVDPCDTISCPSGQVCLEGRCRTLDLCDGVDCENDGEICDPRDGACHSGAADDDQDGQTIAGGDCDDSNATVYLGASELCDGQDQDCDHDVDEGYPDEDEDGFDTCGFGVTEQADCDDHEPRRNPGFQELCDGIDNNCNGDIDDGLLPRPCSTACGSGEDRCEGGRWNCSAPETCECTPAGQVQEGACGNCGVHSRTCGSDLRWGFWNACSGEGLCMPTTTEHQSCGRCGEQTRSCSTSCSWELWGSCEGEGICTPFETESCTATCGTTGSRLCTESCVWGSCTPPTESCNGIDDDCDEEIDEGFRAELVATTFTTLATQDSLCDGRDPRIGISCNTAIHSFCASRPCSVSGFGPVEWSGDDVWIVCVAGADVMTTSYPELASIHPWCDGTTDHEVGIGCSCAAKRYCTDLGYVSGFGPHETTSDTAQVTCITGGAHVLTGFTTLDTFNPGCDGVTSQWGPYCHAAIHRFCRGSEGHTSGFGSVEANVPDDIAWVACVFP